MLTDLVRYLPLVNPVYLSIARAAGNIVTRYRDPSTSFWVDCLTTPIIYDHNEVGLYSKDTTQSSTSFFDEFVLTQAAAPANLAYFESSVLDQAATPASDGVITWSKSEPAGTSAVISTQTSDDNVTWSPPSGPYANSGDIITSPKARYVRFSITLTATTSDYPEVDWVKIEYPGIAPSAPTITSATDYVNAEPVIFTWTVPGSSPAPVWAYYYRIDAAVLSGTSLVAGAVILSATVGSLSVPGLAAGTHTFRIVAQAEPVGFTLSPESAVTIVKRTVGPLPPVVSSPSHPAGAWSNVADVRVNWQAAAGNPIPVATWYYALDAAAASGTLPAAGAVAVTATVTGVTFSGLGDGSHVVQVAGRGAGVLAPVGLAAEITIRKDTSPPSPPRITSATHPSTAPVADPNPVFTVTWTAGTSATTYVSDVRTFYYVLDQASGTVPDPATAATSSGPIVFRGLRNGTWVLHARSRDDAGNVGLTADYAITISYVGAVLDASRVHAVPHPITASPATIRYDLLAPAEAVRLVVLDATGRKVTEMTGGAAFGPNDVTWDVGDRPNGVYMLKVLVTRQGGRTDTVLKKLAVAR